MLLDEARVEGFRRALRHVVPMGGTVLELGGGTGVLSFFAAQQARRVWCVERNPALVRAARGFLAENARGERVEVVEADAFDYLPPARVDVVICEMLHVAMLREKQIAVIDSFRRRYLEAFGPPLPRFVPEASLLAVQPVQRSFEFAGYRAAVPLFENPAFPTPRTLGLAEPAVYATLCYDEPLPHRFTWEGLFEIQSAGRLNAVRLVTKNLLAIQPQRGEVVEWSNQYLVLPLESPLSAEPGQTIGIAFDYTAGGTLESLADSLRVEKASLSCSTSEVRALRRAA